MHMAEIFYKKLLYLVKNTIAVDLVKLLIRCGADALSKNNAIRSPLDFAKQIKDMEMINILTDKKYKF